MCCILWVGGGRAGDPVVVQSGMCAFACLTGRTGVLLQCKVQACTLDLNLDLGVDGDDLGLDGDLHQTQIQDLGLEFGVRFKGKDTVS